MSAKLQSGSNENIDDIYNRELLEEISEMRPSKRDIAVEIGLGLLSYTANPFVSSGVMVVDIGKEIKKYNDFSSHWLSFILHACQFVA